MKTPTLDDFARQLARRLVAAGIQPEEARLDAELLARQTLGWDRARWLERLREEAPAELPGAVEPLVARRTAREPMAYILGRCEFWSREFEVTPAVLIPRPESEIVVEQALLRVAPDATSAIVDVGTGSGCLAVTLAAERPNAHVVATDISAAALEVAARNATRHGVESRLALRLAPLLGGASAPDVIVSNPPYVPAGDRSALPPEVREHEPGTALFAGTDGLDVIRALVAASAESLKTGGWLIFEFGFGQESPVRNILDTAAAWTEVTVVSDLQGIARTAVARHA